jgi:inhibitor of KinA sporulation pathway (predicted exonuclease)
MKKLYKSSFLTLILSIFLSVSVKAQALEDMVNYVRNSDVPAMSRFFDDIVTITMKGTQSAYSKAQAEMILKDFFSKNVVKEFIVMQNGTAPNNNSRYAIGNLNTSNGTYQLYILLKLKDKNFLLHEIRFERP